MKTILLSFVACVSIGLAQTAQALDIVILPGILGYNSNDGGKGDPQPLNNDEAFKVSCLERGGELIAEFKSDGRRGFRCFVPRNQSF